jgi:High-affinity nickel-transport protein
MALVASCGLGFLVGLRHAMEPDHLAAVSTLLADEPRPRRAALLGAFWGMGHLLALVVAGVLLLAFRVQLSARWADGFELLVATVLIGLGLRSFRGAFVMRAGAAPHSHGTVVHAHGVRGEHVHLGPLTLAARPLLVGLAHGLAGSGAVTALALATMPGPGAAAAFVGVFALGSVGGMMLLSGLAGVPLERLARRPAAHALLMGSVGALSLIVGLFWGSLALGRLL